MFQEQLPAGPDSPGVLIPCLSKPLTFLNTVQYRLFIRTSEML